MKSPKKRLGVARGTSLGIAFCISQVLLLVVCLAAALFSLHNGATPVGAFAQFVVSWWVTSAITFIATIGLFFYLEGKEG